MDSLISMMRAAALGLVLTTGAVVAGGAPGQAAEEVNVKSGFAVHGHDPVAYFTSGKPQEGVDAYTATHNGATYRFASAANRDAFKADPGRYAPQYGGYCAFGTAMGRKFDGDPNAWKIVDGKLYLNLNADVQKRWLSNVPGFVKGADNNWPKIESVADKQLEAAPPAGVTLGAQ